MTKPIIWLDGKELADEATAAWEALVEWTDGHGNEPPLVSRGSIIVNLQPSGRLEEVNDVRLRDFMAQAARFAVQNQQGQTIPRLPPKDHAQVIISRGAEQPSASLKRVSLITDVPIVGPGGEPIYDAGLHESGIWYRPSSDLGDIDRHIGDVDDIDGLFDARNLILNDLLGDFDFIDEGSRANALALTLLPFVREYIGSSPTPLHIVIGPQPGSGKTTLVETCLIPGLGDVGISTEPRDDDELRKKITSTLIAGQKSVFFDNLSETLASGTLAAALTSTYWRDRKLQHSIEISVPNTLIWVATGNNTFSSEELRDRMCPIFLEPPDGVPARRRRPSAFKHEDIKMWANANRAQLVGACMTLVLHWLKGPARMLRSGELVRTDEAYQVETTMGSFNRWARTLGEILVAADVPGFLSNRDKLDAVDIDAQETALFFSKIHGWSGGDEFRTKDLVSQCQFGGQLHEEVPLAVGTLTRNPSHMLGRWLARNRNSTYDGVRLRMRAVRGGPSVWKTERIEG